MTRFTEAFGKQYEDNKQKIFTRKFELGGHTFKVRIPFVHESDAMYKLIQEPAIETIETTYQSIAEPLMKFKGQPDAEENFTFTDDDIIVNGRSLRDTAKSKVQTETKITEFFKLFVSENPENSLADLTYEEIAAEFPLSVQLQLMEKISEAISPTYKETKGN